MSGNDIQALLLLAFFAAVLLGGSLYESLFFAAAWLVGLVFLLQWVYAS